MKTVQKLTLDDARVIMAGAEAKAREIGVDMDIAITDDNGSLLMFQRMDNGRITSIDVAISKAFTAAAARRSTRAYGEVSGPGGPRFRYPREQPGTVHDRGGRSAPVRRRADHRRRRLQLRHAGSGRGRGAGGHRRVPREPRLRGAARANREGHLRTGKGGGILACAALCAVVAGCGQEGSDVEPPPFDEQGVVNETWRILKMATAHDVITLEVEMTDLESAPRRRTRVDGAAREPLCGSTHLRVRGWRG